MNIAWSLLWFDNEMLFKLEHSASPGGGLVVKPAGNGA